VTTNERRDIAAIKAEANRLIAYHAHISGQMTADRTALESALIPVSAYIVTAATEAFYRHPEIITTIEAARSASALGAAGRRPGSQINAVYLWSTANIYLVGRKVIVGFGMADDDPERTFSMLDFWERAALAYRGDGHRQAWDAGFVLRPYGDDVTDELLAGVHLIKDDDERARIKRFNAVVMSYLFLLYFDTRVGTGDSGPYPLADGRVLLVRDFYRLSKSDFWWSDVAAGVPYQHLTAALVLDAVELKVNDWGTSITDPEDYLDHLVGFGLFTTDTPDRSLRTVPLSELDGLLSEVKAAQRALYRQIAAMTRREKIACGAHVYFTFPKPLAEEAGVADQIDWTVPRDTLDTIYPMIEAIEGDNTPPPGDEDYYAPIA
jgi:hypothetical protein